MLDDFDNLRRNWRANWLSSIQEFADLEMQQATWLNPANKNPHYSFVEVFASYFDGLSLCNNDGGYPARVEEGLLSEIEARAAFDLHAALNGYEPPDNDAYDHPAILADESWHRIVALATETQQRLASIIVETELDALLVCSSYAIDAARR